MKERLLAIINEMLEESNQEPIESLNKSINLRDDLNMDSLMLAELTVKIEDEFNIDVFEDGIVQTVEEVLSKIKGE